MTAIPTTIKIQHKVLFVCIHNSARSQIAEAFLNKYGDGILIAESAGLKAGKLNPYAIKILQEAGIDISQKGTRDVFDLFRQGELYHAVITVCDEASAEGCPIFPGTLRRLGWSFADPSTFVGSEQQILEQTRKVRDEIKASVLAFIEEAKHMDYWVK